MSEFQITINKTINSNGQSADITSPNSGTSILQIIGTWSGTLVVQGSNNDTDYFNIYSYNENTKLFEDEITSNSVFSVNTNGFKSLRILSTSWVSGTANISVHGSDSCSLIKTDTQLRSNDGKLLSSVSYGEHRNLSVSVGEGSQKDSLDRIRTSSITSLINAYHSASDHALLFTSSVTGTGTQTLNTDTASMDLTIGTASGDEIIRQTKRYLHYNPGRSYIATFSGVLGSPKTNVETKLGYFDNEDGFFFKVDENGVYVVLRSSTSGSPVDTIVHQNNFNIDTLDGNGNSGVTLDTSMHNLYVIDYVWHGAGRVRFGVVSPDKIIYCHEITLANTVPTVYMRTPSLPIRAQITNTGVSASSTTMKFVCFSLNKESTDKNVPSVNFSADRGTTNVSVGSGNTAPLISIRPKTTFKGITNRVPILTKEVPIISISNPLLVRVYLNATLTGASFNSVDANSSVEFDTSATAVSGGTKVKTFYVGGLSGQSAVTSFTTLSDILFLASNVAGNTTDILTIVVTNLGSGNTQVNGGLVWEEYQ